MSIIVLFLLLFFLYCSFASYLVFFSTFTLCFSFLIFIFSYLSSLTFFYSCMSFSDHFFPTLTLFELFSLSFFCLFLALCPSICFPFPYTSLSFSHSAFPFQLLSPSLSLHFSTLLLWLFLSSTLFLPFLSLFPRRPRIVLSLCNSSLLCISASSDHSSLASSFALPNKTPPNPYHHTELSAQSITRGRLLNRPSVSISAVCRTMFTADSLVWLLESL